MKKGRLLNAGITSTMVRMGHTDQITIADAGLPIPEGVKRIDLAITKNYPSFIRVFETTLDEMVVEKVVLAEEIKTQNPELLKQIMEKIGDIPVEWMSHEAFKKQTAKSKAVIRTGECTPYANIILQSGVDFEGDSHE